MSALYITYEANNEEKNVKLLFLNVYFAYNHLGHNFCWIDLSKIKILQKSADDFKKETRKVSYSLLNRHQGKNMNK